MPDAFDPAAEFLAHLHVIETAARAVCRGKAIPDDDVEDFVSTFKAELIDCDYAVLRRFRRESSLSTYIVSLVKHSFVEWSRQRTGRWRPSAAARREGALAEELERLVHREGYRLSAAGEKLRTEGKTALSDAALAQLVPGLLDREPLRPVDEGSDPLDHAPATERADAAVEAGEAAQARRRMREILRPVLDRLPAEDAVILQLRVVRRMKVSHIARAMGLEQKPLYARIDRILDRMRRELANAGVDATMVKRLLETAEDE